MICSLLCLERQSNFSHHDFCLTRARLSQLAAANFSITAIFMRCIKAYSGSKVKYCEYIWQKEYRSESINTVQKVFKYRTLVQIFTIKDKILRGFKRHLKWITGYLTFRIEIRPGLKMLDQNVASLEALITSYSLLERNFSHPFM